MALLRRNAKSRRITPERSGLAGKLAISTVIEYEHVLGALLLGLVFLAALVVTANHEALHRAGRTSPYWLWRLAGSSGMLLLLTFCYGFYLALYERAVALDWRRLVPHGLLALLPVVASRGLAMFEHSVYHEPVYYTPLPLTAMIFAIAYGGRTAAYLSALLSVIIAVVSVGPAGEVPFGLTITLLGGSVVGALTTGRIRRLSKPLRVGFAVGAVQAALALAAAAASRQAIDPHWMIIPAINGIACGGVVLAFLPLVERAFKVTTDLTLLELSDQNHKLLRRLALDAPGTYHHSQILGGLAEAAGEAIGANSLLLRVGAYFHDLGKINKPEYFVENEGLRGSLHDRLSPAMSTLIIAAHSKDGAEIAADYRLPQVIIDLIQQHHGTSLIEYFYRKAIDEQGGLAGVKEEFFRHPGPKPSSKEVGILLLADAVESASRALSAPSPSRIERRVHEVISSKLMDGQLDECALTLAEVHRVEACLVKGLTHIFHGRISYPRPLPKRPSAAPSHTSDSRDPLPLG